MLESKKENFPLISILIPCYNHFEYIEEAILSVINQTYKNIQLVVIDDCSTDGTVDVLLELQCKYKFEIILNDKNLGVQKNIIKGFASIKGEFISFMASDEILDLNKIKEQYEFLVSNKLDGVLGSHYVFSENKGPEKADMSEVVKLFSGGEMLNSLYVSDECGPLTQSGLFKEEVIRETMCYRGVFQSEDWSILIKILEKYNIGFLDKPYFYYRITESNLHKDYWKTFPMRVEVISRITPVNLKSKGLANIMGSMSSYCVNDGDRFLGVKFLISSVVFDPTAKRIFNSLKIMIIFVFNRLFFRSNKL